MPVEIVDGVGVKWGASQGTGLDDVERRERPTWHAMVAHGVRPLVAISVKELAVPDDRIT
jgi:hypothetical protein